MQKVTVCDLILTTEEAEFLERAGLKQFGPHEQYPIHRAVQLLVKQALSAAQKDRRETLVLRPGCSYEVVIPPYKGKLNG